MAERDRVEAENTSTRVAQSLREGIRLYNIDEYAKSLSALEEGLRLDPENTQVREYIVRDIVALKREEEKTVPPDSPFYELVMNLERLGDDAFERGEDRESIKYFERILLIFPFNESARVRFTKALGKTDPVLARDILDGTFRTAKDLYAQKGKRREAAAKLDLILNVDPDFAPARELRGRIDAETKEGEKTATAKDVARAAELHSRGAALYGQNRPGEAADLWRRSLELNPDNVEARVSLSRAESDLRRRKDRDAESSSPAVSEARIRMKKHYLDGINYYMDGLYREAISEWEAILKVDPDYENVNTNIDRARRRLMYGAERMPNDRKS
jgi:tetratricopeptide (TPR) repeat protein